MVSTSAPSASNRVRALADSLVPGRPMADIGTDHARLPAWAVRNGIVPRAIAVDVAVGPLARARSNLRAWGIADVELRRGDGLRALAPGEAASIVLAGMGGALLRTLVDRDVDVARTAERLIVQPNTQWTSTRSWIAAHGWRLTDEIMTEERGRFFLTLVVSLENSNDAARWTPEDLLLGPLLRRRDDPVHARWRAREAARLRHALRRAGPSRTDLEVRLACVERG